MGIESTSDARNVSSLPALELELDEHMMGKRMHPGRRLKAEE